MKKKLFMFYEKKSNLEKFEFSDIYNIDVLPHLINEDVLFQESFDIHEL